MVKGKRSLRKKSRTGIRREFLEMGKKRHRHETDLNYWVHHVLHWHAFLFAVVGVLVVGRTMF